MTARAATLAPATVSIDPNARYSRRAVAVHFFGRSPRWLADRLEKLMRDEGFPRPISCIGRPLWSGADLLAWQNRRKEAPRFDRQNAAPNVEDITALLADRARKAARKR